MNELKQDQPTQPAGAGDTTAPAAPTAAGGGAVVPHRDTQLDEGQRLRAMASLGDPVRKELFDLVRGAGHALSRDECAQSLGLPKSTVRVHLDRLVEEALLKVEYRKLGEKTGPGSGRPSKLYAVAVGEISASVPPRQYDLAAALLAAAVQRSIDTGEGVESAMATVAFDEGRRLGAEAGNIHDLLHANGYSPEPDAQGGTIMANCPFHRLSQDHTGVVCSLNGSLLAGALEGCGDCRHDLAPDEEISHCCARLVPRE
ncbi:putative ArsR family transcriptional regulator [Arthrobacter stackebrandtii]|uniref:ArsR family transcriptional regulator n=1 Tax=Arthrobacter stackebrandtii TaxID=272161 RepID=A0ABS4YYY8_9MICC|nr:transcriptional regulator [Arthrobacter stackebrandtii]MBP2413690.1 putative ArsR family transcriptional regulator [Arthrobacter stackebrandtii]PYG99988.1 transcriptional regulator [Arthrobacter stackebrandtii]